MPKPRPEIRVLGGSFAQAQRLGLTWDSRRNLLSSSSIHHDLDGTQRSHWLAHLLIDGLLHLRKFRLCNQFTTSPKVSTVGQGRIGKIGLGRIEIPSNPAI